LARRGSGTTIATATGALIALFLYYGKNEFLVFENRVERRLVILDRVLIFEDRFLICDNGCLIFQDRLLVRKYFAV
jgi:hypothetical protein